MQVCPQTRTCFAAQWLDSPVRRRGMAGGGKRQNMTLISIRTIVERTGRSRKQAGPASRAAGRTSYARTRRVSRVHQHDIKCRSTRSEYKRTALSFTVMRPCIRSPGDAIRSAAEGIGGSRYGTIPARTENFANCRGSPVMSLSRPPNRRASGFSLR